jgi:hypothetical protein
MIMRKGVNWTRRVMDWGRGGMVEETRKVRGGRLLGNVDLISEDLKTAISCLCSQTNEVLSGCSSLAFEWKPLKIQKSLRPFPRSI